MASDSRFTDLRPAHNHCCWCLISELTCVRCCVSNKTVTMRLVSTNFDVVAYVYVWNRAGNNGGALSQHWDRQRQPYVQAGSPALCGSAYIRFTQQEFAQSCGSRSSRVSAYLGEPHLSEMRISSGRTLEFPDSHFANWAYARACVCRHTRTPADAYFSQASSPSGGICVRTPLSRIPFCWTAETAVNLHCTLDVLISCHLESWIAVCIGVLSWDLACCIKEGITGGRYTYIYIHIHTYNIYIYMCRERDRHVCIYIYIQYRYHDNDIIYIYIYIERERDR